MGPPGQAGGHAGAPIGWLAWTLADRHQSLIGPVLGLLVRGMVWVVDPAAFLFRSGGVVPTAILAASLALAGLVVVVVVAAGTRTTATARPRRGRRHRPTKPGRAQKDPVR